MDESSFLMIQIAYLPANAIVVNPPNPLEIHEKLDQTE